MSYIKTLDDAIALYDHDRFDECEVKLRKLVDGPTLPAHYKVKALVLLGLIVGSWGEAHTCQAGAEMNWRTARRQYPVGKNETMDKYLAEAEEQLNRLREKLEKKDKRAKGSDHEDAAKEQLNSLGEKQEKGEEKKKEMAQDSDWEDAADVAMEGTGNDEAETWEMVEDQDEDEDDLVKVETMDEVPGPEPTAVGDVSSQKP